MKTNQPINQPTNHQSPIGVCMCILQDWCWIEHIPFIDMFKFEFIVQFLIDHFVQTVIFSHTLFVLICFICLKCDWLFRLYYHIIFNCSIVFSYIIAFILLIRMGLLYAVIKRYSVSLFRSPFFGHLQVFACEMSLVFRLKCTTVVFPSYFRSVSVPFVCIISGSCSRWSSSRCLDASALSSLLLSPRSPLSIDTYNPSTSYLGCKTSCIVIRFLILSFICLSFSRVYLPNFPEYHTREITLVFIPFIKILQYCLVSSSFFVLLIYNLLFLSSQPVWWRPLPIFSIICTFFLHQTF